MESPPHMFFSVARFVPDDQEVLTLQAGTQVGAALSLMRDHDYDQLPVCVGDEFIGIFSYRSLSRGLVVLAANRDPLQIQVEDVVDEVPIVSARSQLEEVLPILQADGVLVVGSETELTAIVAAADVSATLWESARLFVMLQDVELATRELVLSCVTDAELVAAIARVVRDEEGTSPINLEELTFGELLGIVFMQVNWGSHFRHAFGRQRDLVMSVLEPVREIRNKVFHFRDDVSAAELQVLRVAVLWLRRRILIRRGQAA